MYSEAICVVGWVDCAVLALIPVLAWYFIINGLDDLLIDLVFLRLLRRPDPDPPIPARERSLAILIPAWKEEAVIARMLQHNGNAVRYANFEFFVGAYPNDPGTFRAVESVAAVQSNVHLCLTPHAGPTSKADCLNWIYQHVLLHEERTGQRFDAIVLQDSEDLVHPQALAEINRYLGRYDMVQIPVIPLATPWVEWTHGIYCDEFAESQTKDLRVRQFLGGFLPSCGVGTALSRRAIEELARRYQNRIFEPECLTEDYELGLRVHRAGLAQCFVPLRVPAAVATREFFPHSFRTAVRQRTRWITGIALQGWERNGWGRSWKEGYWFWRDRKGLAGHLVSLVANAIFGWGLVTAAWSWYAGTPWALGQVNPVLVWTGATIQMWRVAWRSACVARLYGWGFACLMPLRLIWSNLINFAATACAVRQFAESKFRGKPLVWLKTSHAFPTTAALRPAPEAKAARVS